MLLRLGFLLLLLLILLLLLGLPLFPLLVPLPTDSGRDSGLLAGCQPVGILGDALALRFSVVVQDAAVTGLVRPQDGWLCGFQLWVGRIRLEAHLIGEAAQGIVEWIEFLY